MKYLIIFDWDSSGRPIRINHKETEEEAASLVNSMLNEFPNSFYVSDVVERDMAFVKVNDDKKSVTDLISKKEEHYIARREKETKAQRRGAYKAEADHLHLEEERGEVPAGTWAAKVAEIKARIPKP